MNWLLLCSFNIPETERLNFYFIVLPKKKEEQEALEKEQQVAQQEALRQERMKEEAEVIARQEAYEKAASEEVVIDTAPRPIPPEVTGSLATVAEDEEEDAEKKGMGV